MYQTVEEYLLSHGFDPSELPQNWQIWTEDKLRKYPLTSAALDWLKKHSGEIQKERVFTYLDSLADSNARLYVGADVILELFFGLPEDDAMKLIVEWRERRKR